VRRLTLLLAGAALWLFLAAIPALADGGPHVAATNSGVGGLTADSCAGCHRAHTAQGALLLVQDQSTLCLACHGATGTGATTNVENGVQYTLAAASTGQVRGTVILGALRNGGFVTAAIGSGAAVRVAYMSGSSVRENAKVPVRVDGTGAIAGRSGRASPAPGPRTTAGRAAGCPPGPVKRRLSTLDTLGGGGAVLANTERSAILAGGVRTAAAPAGRASTLSRTGAIGAIEPTTCACMISRCGATTMARATGRAPMKASRGTTVTAPTTPWFR